MLATLSKRAWQSPRIDEPRHLTEALAERRRQLGVRTIAAAAPPPRARSICSVQLQPQYLIVNGLLGVGVEGVVSLWSLARSAILALVAAVLMAALAVAWSAGWDFQIASGRVVQLWTDYSRIIDRIYDLIDRTARFIVPIATIGGAIYGVYHKWQYGKGRMHIHIGEFLKRDDKRLTPTGKKLGGLVERPRPGREYGPTIFPPEELEQTLKRMRWGKIDKADVALTNELTKLKQQLEQWGNLEANYNRHKAQAHLLKGAIAAARAAKTKNGNGDKRKDDTEAFEQFKAAHELNRGDAEALEYMAHQRVRLGDNANALIDFEKRLAEKQENPLLVSRAMKFQAAIRENEGAARLLQNPATRPDLEPNLQGARDLLKGAMDTLPDGERGGLEEAELFELRGRVHKVRQTFNNATNDYTAAERLYHRIANHTSDLDVKKIAEAGLTRVKKMLEEIRLRPLPAPDAPRPNGVGDEPPI
jgi:hypothetical protein